MKTLNNTTLTMEQIAKLPKIGSTVNNWRQRRIDLYEHPKHQERLVTIGITFDLSLTVICEELRTQYATALDYITHGREYVSD